MKTNMDCDRCGGQEICCSQRVLITSVEAQRLGLPPTTKYLNEYNTVCQFLKNNRCTVYAKRPRACITFNCCNPGQLKFAPDTPEIMKQLMIDSLEPRHWLSVTVNQRQSLKVG